MSEDTAHGQHFEPTNGETKGPIPVAQPQPLTTEELLEAQAHRVEELGTRTASLIMAAYDAFNDFVIAQQQFFITLTQTRPENANRAANSTPTQA